MKYMCLECGAEFDEPQQIIERHGFADGPHETFLSCPQCSGEYTIKLACDHCGHTLRDKYVLVKKTKERICMDCVIEYEVGEENE